MLSNFLKNNQILFGLNANNKKHLFQELSSKSSFINKIINDKILFNRIMDREKLGNTGIGNGVALPSALLDNISKTFVLFSLLSKPINYDSADNKKVDIICMVVSPLSSRAKHLYLLSNFSRFLKNEDILNRLRGCENPDSLFAVLLNFNISSAA